MFKINNLLKIFIINNKLLFVLFAFLSIIFSNVSAQDDPIEKGLKAINENVIKAQVGFLASDWTEGREVGERGEYLAGEYIASMLQLYGIKPFGDMTNSDSTQSRSYFQNFVLLKTTEEAEQAPLLKTVEEKNTQEFDIDFSVRTIESTYEILKESAIIKTTSSTTQVTVRNIIGIIEGKNTEQYIVLGAHYDHLGIWNGYVWNGADDNASGTVGIMTIAKAIVETGVKPEKSIIIALWTAEEVGLLGSRYYLDNLNYPLDRIKLNLNFDMISRYIADNEPRSVTMTYTDKYHPEFRDITDSNLRKYGIDLIVDYQPSADPPGGSDHRSFTAKGIPVMRFKPGHREEYHTPLDEISTINWDIMEKIIKIGFANIWHLANSEW